MDIVHLDLFELAAEMFRSCRKTMFNPKGGQTWALSMNIDRKESVFDVYNYCGFSGNGNGIYE